MLRQQTQVFQGSWVCLHHHPIPDRRFQPCQKQVNGGFVLNALIAQTQLQVPKLCHKCTHARGLLQVQQTIPELHLLVHLIKLRFQHIQQTIKLPVVEDGGTVLGVTPPPSQCVTLKVTHDKAASGTAGAERHAIHILAHLEKEVVYFHLLSRESRRFGQLHFPRH